MERGESTTTRVYGGRFYLRRRQRLWRGGRRGWIFGGRGWKRRVKENEGNRGLVDEKVSLRCLPWLRCSEPSPASLPLSLISNL